MTIALCWLAAAGWLAGPGRPRRPRRRITDGAGSGSAASSRHRRPAGRTTPRAGVHLSRPAATVIAAVATAAACVAIAGVGTGVIAALVTAPGAALLVRRLHSRVGPGLDHGELDRVPMVLDLTAVVLASGQPVDAALRSVRPLAGPWLGAQLGRVAGLLYLGAEPPDAWAPLAADPRLRPVAVAAIRSAGSGIRLAAGFVELAAELRAESMAGAQARAQRAGVWAIAPLGLCFLPAFVCIGIVPVVIGVAGNLFGTLR